jgi:hypothetical protein
MATRMSRCDSRRSHAVTPGGVRMESALPLRRVTPLYPTRPDPTRPLITPYGHGPRAAHPSGLCALVVQISAKHTDRNAQEGLS